MEPVLVLATAVILLIVLPDITNEDVLAPESHMPVKLPEEVVLRLLMFCKVFPLMLHDEATEAPEAMPYRAVVVAVDVPSTRMLLVAAPVLLLPTILLLTDAGDVALLKYIPVNVEAAGAVPMFFISKPPI